MAVRGWAYSDFVPKSENGELKRYEATLGRFIVLFNKIENMIVEITKNCVEKIDQRNLINIIDKESSFAMKVKFLRLLSLSDLGSVLSDIPLDLIEEVSRKRNLLVHSYIDVDLCDGTCVLRSRRKVTRVSIDAMERIIDQCVNICTTLKTAEAKLDFR